MKNLLSLAATALFLITVAITPRFAPAEQRSAPAPNPRFPLLVQRVNPLDEVLRQLQDADSDSDKSEARAKLRGLLEEEYDRLMEDEANELERLEQRLVDLREQLVRRRAAKAKMVDLRLETLVNEAEGFGWPGERSRGRAYGGPEPDSSTTNADCFLTCRFPSRRSSQQPRWHPWGRLHVELGER